MEFKECPKCKKTMFKPRGFAKGKRICLKCEGKESPVIAIEDVK